MQPRASFLSYSREELLAQFKIDELSVPNNLQIYHESSLFLFMETWLNHLVPDANVDLLGFTAVRADRHTKASGKTRVGDSSCMSTTAGVTQDISP